MELQATNDNRNTQLEFYGKAGEYFKIWIVNLLLTIITIGIYSPWAKIRSRRYLYGNTILDNSPFDYVADPVRILKGRVIAVVLFVVFTNSSYLPEYLQAIFGLLFMLAIPWVVVKSLSFNLYNTTYRNLRFNFQGQYLQALLVYIALPVGMVLSLGLSYPHFIKKQKQFIINNSRYGTNEFKMSDNLKSMYLIFFRPLAPIIILILILAAASSQLSSLNLEPNLRHLILATPYLFIFVLIIMLVWVYAYLYAQISNLIINHTKISNYQFHSHLKTNQMAWLFVSNILSIMLSFGLLIPWAKIRLLRYRINCISLDIEGDLNEFVSAEEKRVAAVGEEIGALFDIDIGL